MFTITTVYNGTGNRLWLMARILARLHSSIAFVNFIKIRLPIKNSEY